MPRFLVVVLAIFVGLAALQKLVSGIGTGRSRLGTSVSWQPTFSPITFSINQNGEVSISASQGIVTPLGRIAIGLEYPVNPAPEYILVVIRNRQYGSQDVYKIASGCAFRAHYKGEGNIVIDDRKVVVDAISGTIEIVAVDANSSANSPEFVSTPEWPSAAAPYGSTPTASWRNSSSVPRVFFVDGARTVVNPGESAQLKGIVEWREEDRCKVLAVDGEDELGFRTKYYFPLSPPLR